MSWLDKYFNTGISNLQQNGVPLPPQKTLDVIGATLADDPAQNRTIMTVTSTPNHYPFGPAAKLFTPPDIGAFTLENPSPNSATEASSAVIQNHPSGYGLVIYGTGTSAHACFNGAFKTRGANTTLIVQVDAPYWDNQPDGTGVSLAPPYGGIFIYSPANDKAVMYGVYAGATPSAGTGNSINLFHFNMPGASTIGVFQQLPAHPTFPIWLKWHDDGVNYNFSYSFDGDFSYSPIVKESRTAFLADAGTLVGVAAGSQQSSGTRAGNHAFSMWLGSWNLS